MLRNIIKARSARAVVVLGLAITAVPSSGAAQGASLAANDGPTGCQPTASTPVPQPTQAQLDVAGLGDLPLAPNSARRDLVAAPFNDPTAVDNPLFPISDLHSAILNGHVDGKVFHTETTLLPFTRIIEWTPGQCVRVLVSQYMAFLDGNLQETAIDLYAQADDGSVWYLGEDVNDYSANGFIVTTEGTWQAGIDGPFAMIMPSDPQVGDAHRAENIPGNSFEEVHISKIDQTFDGPSGPVSGGIVATEIHQDAAPSDKLFAPGYGEFRSTDGPDVEAMALASPTDSLPGGVPAELKTISNGADRIFASRLATPLQWHHAQTIAQSMLDAWATFSAGDVPPRLGEADPCRAGGPGRADRVTGPFGDPRGVDRRGVREQRPAAPLPTGHRDRHHAVRALGSACPGGCDRRVPAAACVATWSRSNGSVIASRTRSILSHGRSSTRWSVSSERRWSTTTSGPPRTRRVPFGKSSPISSEGGRAATAGEHREPRPSLEGIMHAGSAHADEPSAFPRK